jgi:hypothetical protein
LRGKMPEIASAAGARYQLLDPDYGPISELKGEEAEAEIDEANQRSLDHLWRQIPEIHPNTAVPAVADTFVNQALAKREKMPGNAQLRAMLRLYALGK